MNKDDLLNILAPLSNLVIHGYEYQKEAEEIVDQIPSGDRREVLEMLNDLLGGPFGRAESETPGAHKVKQLLSARFAEERMMRNAERG